MNKGQAFILRAAIATLLCASPILTSVSAEQGGDAIENVSIPGGEMDAALKTLARQTGLQLLYDRKTVEGMTTKGVKGAKTLQDAVSQLLDGTTLKTKLDSSGAILIVAPAAAMAPGDRSGLQLDGFLVARMDAQTLADSNQAASNREADNLDQALEEVIVTAQKREERLQDVPVPVTALAAETLVRSNQLRLQDYYNKVPGVSLTLIGDGSAPTIAIRGITTGGITNSTVGIVVDDVSYGATVFPGVAPTAPDVDPGDIARVEVLRGPQGTLYGASSMGGLLKYVTIDPSTEAVTGSVRAGFDSVEDGEMGYNLRASINVPLGDTFAVRASGFTIRDPGFVDNPASGQRDVNRRNSDGGRLSALWRPADNLSLKLSAVYQTSDRPGTSDVDVTLGGSLQQSLLRGTGVYNRKSQVYSATFLATLGQVDLTSVTGYTVDNTDTVQDLSVGIYGSNAVTLFGVTGAAGRLDRSTKKFSQEIRASMPLGQRVHWLVGAYYTSEDTLADLNNRAANPATGATLGSLLTFYQPVDYDEYAAFTNFTFDVTDRFDIQVGGRVSETKLFFSALRGGPLSVTFFGSDPSPVPGVGGKDHPFTYLVTPRFKIAPNLMVYGRVATGYRPGGLNSNCASTGPQAIVPCQYDPDTTQNYEIGFKGDLLQNRLSLDASLYYIDWKDVQTPLTINGLGFNDNAGHAKSQGIELTTELRPMDNLRLSAWIVFNEAELKEPFPANATNVSGRPGDRLPYSSRISGSFSLDQDVPLSNDITVFWGGSVSYVGDRKGVFKAANVTRETFPSYAQIDLRAGVKRNAWTLDAFLNNAGDKRGVLRSGLESLRPTLITYIQPRTVGLTLSRDF